MVKSLFTVVRIFARNDYLTALELETRLNLALSNRSDKYV